MEINAYSLYQLMENGQIWYVQTFLKTNDTVV
jgi:hypothetical protein